MPRKVDGKELPFILDSGATISITPEEIVSDDKVLKERVLIWEINGMLSTRKMALVDINVVSQDFKQKVALMASEILGGQAILALDFCDKYSRDRVQEFADPMKQQLC